MVVNTIIPTILAKPLQPSIKLKALVTPARAKHVNKIWSSVETWWESDKVQEAKKMFCNQYVRIKSNKLYELKKLIK